MTISGAYTPARLLTDGATVAFPFTFAVNATDQVVVILKENTSGTETVLTETTHYTVALAAVGGTVTTVATYAAGYTVVIKRSTDLLQETDLVEGERFNAEVLEDAYDLLTMMVQEIEEILDRCIKFTQGSAYSDIDLPDPDAEALLGWDAAGTGLTNYTGLVSAATPSATTYDPMLIDATFTYPGGVLGVFALNPGTTARNFNPTGTFPEGYTVVVHNIGTAAIVVFDSAGGAQNVFPGTAGLFSYMGGTWR